MGEYVFQILTLAENKEIPEARTRYTGSTR